MIVNVMGVTKQYSQCAKSVFVPDGFSHCDVCIAEYPLKQVEEHSLSLQRYIWSRQTPPEPTVVNTASRKLEEEMLAEALQDTDLDRNTLDGEEEYQQVPLFLCF